MGARARRQVPARSKPKTVPSGMGPQPPAKPPFFPWADGPFTPEGVLVLLRDGVLKDNSALPPATGPAISTLTHTLNLCWWQVKGWTKPWREEQKQLQRIGEAIWVLTEILPKQREEYAAVHAAMERWDMTAATRAQADLAAFDALVTAAHAARKRGLPLALNMMLVTSKPIERWKDFAPKLAAVFQSALPSRPKAALYRFIVAVTFIITNKETTFDAVQTAFKKQRFDRGKCTG